MFWFDLHWQFQQLLLPWWWAIQFVLLTITVVTGYLTLKKPLLAVAITIACSPMYLLRANLFGVPFTFLEVLIWVSFVGFCFYLLRGGTANLANLKPFRGPLLLILLAATIGLAIAPDLRMAAGLWKAYVVEPIMLFIMIRSLVATNTDRKLLIAALSLPALAISAIAIYQKFTAFGIAEPGWVGADHRRVTSIFTSPNAIGLFVVPVAILIFGWLLEKIKSKTAPYQIIALLAIILALFFSVSQGSFLALGAGVVTLLIGFAISKKSKLLWVMLLMLFLADIALLASSDSLRSIALFQDPAGQNRLSLWSLGWEHLTQNPFAFIFGAGIGGFAELHEATRDPLIIEPLLYPHTIILNFWLEFGLLGLAGFIWLLIIFFKQTIHTSKSNTQLLTLGISAAMVALLTHGLVDVPYFKNDLAVLFWVIVGIL